MESTAIGLGGLLVFVIVAVIAFKLLKSLVKAMFVGVVLLVLLGAWLAYSAGYFG
jgi:hypothetical protein